VKKGISIWSFTQEKYKEIFMQAKEFGFDGVELSLDEKGVVSLESNEKDLLEVRAMANECGIELYSVATGLYWNNLLTSADKVQREKTKNIVKKHIETAAILGCDTILVVPGATGVDFAPQLGITPYKDAYRYALEAIGELAAFAQQHKVNIGIENVWNKFLLSPLEMKAFIDEVNNPFVGAYFDVGNVVINSYPEHWIDILGKRIKKVHFKDFKRCIGTADAVCDLLAGDVDFDEVMKALHEIGYDDWVTAEVGTYKKHNEMMLQHTSIAMDIILKK